jgi:hypothetical protein
MLKKECSPVSPASFTDGGLAEQCPEWGRKMRVQKAFPMLKRMFLKPLFSSHPFRGPMLSNALKEVQEGDRKLSQCLKRMFL